MIKKFGSKAEISTSMMVVLIICIIILAFFIVIIVKANNSSNKASACEALNGQCRDNDCQSGEMKVVSDCKDNKICCVSPDFLEAST